jgi:hypothetical protein
VRIVLIELDEMGEVAHLARCRFNERQLLARKESGSGALVAWELTGPLGQKICPEDINPATEL